MIIDSSAIVAIFFRESGAENLLSAIVEADFAGVGTPTAVETGLVLTAALGRDATEPLLRFFEESGIEILSIHGSSLAARNRRIRTIRQRPSSGVAEFRRLHDVCDGVCCGAAASLPRQRLSED